MREGAFIVQDPAQALLAWYADLPPDATLYDACAAPGRQVDRARPRRGAASSRATPAAPGSGASPRTSAAPAAGASTRSSPTRSRRRSGRSSAVLLDAPCLGTGTFARHPDARWRVTPEALATLVERQAELLDHAAAAVAPGGLLLYSTCSIEPEENAQQVERFLARHPEFRREPSETFPADPDSPEGDLMILPQRHQMDGAFAARLRRTRA